MILTLVGGPYDGTDILAPSWPNPPSMELRPEPKVTVWSCEAGCHFVVGKALYILREDGRGRLDYAGAPPVRMGPNP